MATTAQRTHLASLMRFLLANEPLIHYRQRRPMTTRGLYEQQLADLFADGGSIYSDCSETVTLLCRMAGLQDPNGTGYDGTGYTGTLLANLPHYTDPRAANVGALVVFGPGTGDHVGMVMTPGADPWVFDHGSEDGPRRRRLSTVARSHRPPVTFLSIADL